MSGIALQSPSRASSTNRLLPRFVAAITKAFTGRETTRLALVKVACPVGLSSRNGLRPSTGFPSTCSNHAGGRRQTVSPRRSVPIHRQRQSGRGVTTMRALPCVRDREDGAAELMASSRKGIRSLDGLIDALDQSVDFTDADPSAHPCAQHRKYDGAAAVGLTREALCVSLGPYVAHELGADGVDGD